MTNCKKCHFLAKEVTPTSQNSGMHSFSFSLTKEEREKFEKSLSSSFWENYSLKCHMGVWYAGVGNTDNAKVQISKKRCSEDCFYFPYRNDMLFPAAEILQKRSQEAAAIKKSNFYTRVGLYIAAGALLVSAIFEFSKG